MSRKAQINIQNNNNSMHNFLNQETYEVKFLAQTVD